MVAHVLGLLLGHRQPDQPDLAERVARAELLGERDHLLLGLQRGRVHRRARSTPSRSRASLWKSATPAIRKPPLRPLAPPATVPASSRTRVDPVLREPAGARQPADPPADHARLHLEVAVERRPRLVGRVEPERRGAGAHARPPRTSTVIAPPRRADRDQLRGRVPSRPRCRQRHVHGHRAVPLHPVERDGHRAEADLVLLARVRDALAANSLQVARAACSSW